MMELQSLENLEERIKEAVQRIEDLKQENQNMFSSTDLFSHKISGFEVKNKSLVDENHKLKQQIRKVDSEIRSKEQVLKHRIEKLIQKLNLLESGG